MNIEVDTVKGFQDYLPPQSLQRSAIRKIVEKHFRLHGFAPTETPVVEFDELMKSDVLDGDDEAISDRFRLKDRAGRNLGLRYEFTFQLARIFKMNPNIKLPFRRYQIGENFRDEPTRVGRTRQFTQCDVDIIGDGSVSAEASCLHVFADIFKELGVSAEVHINNRQLLNALIESVELSSTKQVLREVDKLDKIGEDQLKTNLRKYGDANQIATLFKLFEKDLSFFAANAFDGAESVQNLLAKCKQLGIVSQFRPSLVRGFSYYTGNVFEIVIKGTKTALAGGGRYDKAVGKLLQRDLPAVGLSFSLEAIMGLCPDEVSALSVDPIALAMLISIGKDSATAQLAKQLRMEGLSCIISSEKIGKAMEYANSLSIPYAVFLGEDEVSKKKVKIRAMKSGEEKLVSQAQLIKLLRQPLLQ